MSKDLKEEVKELNKRISELEKMINMLVQPIRDVSETTNKYLRLTGILLDHGGLTPDLLLPDVKDPISKEIVRVLLSRSGQNISQITELIRSRRGSASRRIIREKLKDLEGENIVQRHKKGAIDVYYITEKVIKKWSQMLGFNI